ncbi:MAG: hypothetical protein ABIQ02_13600, partial [Saprospiraceae bacterium]
NHKPIEEFQYVKILTLKELRNYVEYFKPGFSLMETKLIANHLLKLSDRINDRRTRSSHQAFFR